jgi:hypothetical protein
MSAFGVTADVTIKLSQVMSAFDPKRTFDEIEEGAFTVA